MARCSECGEPAGFIMSMCRACIELQEAARRQKGADQGPDGKADSDNAGAGTTVPSRQTVAGAGFGIASMVFSVLPALLTLAGFANYLFEARSHAWGEDMMEYGIILLFMSPLPLIGLLLAFWAKSMRNLCLALALVYILGFPLLILLVG